MRLCTFQGLKEGIIGFKRTVHSTREHGRCSNRHQHPRAVIMRLTVRSCCTGVGPNIRIPVAKIPDVQSRRYQISVSGTPTIIHEAASHNSANQLSVIVIPGNPGMDRTSPLHVNTCQARPCVSLAVHLNHKP